MFFNYINEFKRYLYFFFEIKLRLIYIFISILITFIICYYYKDEITFILTNYLLYNMSSHRFIFTELTQIFITYIKFSFFISIFINVPFVILHFFYFFISSLYKHELKKNIIIIMFFLLNYILSILLTYFFIFPNLLNFFLIFEKNNIFFPLHFEAKIEEFFSVMFVLFFNITLSFQIPILLYILIYNNIIDIYFIIKNRKIFYLFFLILSAFIAPPEILTQFFIFILIIFLFEFFIFINIFYNNI